MLTGFAASALSTTIQEDSIETEEEQSPRPNDSSVLLTDSGEFAKGNSASTSDVPLADSSGLKHSSSKDHSSRGATGLSPSLSHPSRSKYQAEWFRTLSKQTIPTAIAIETTCKEMEVTLVSDYE